MVIGELKPQAHALGDDIRVAMGKEPKHIESEAGLYSGRSTSESKSRNENLTLRKLASNPRAQCADRPSGDANLLHKGWYPNSTSTVVDSHAGTVSRAEYGSNPIIFQNSGTLSTIGMDQNTNALDREAVEVGSSEPTI